MTAQTLSMHNRLPCLQAQTSSACSRWCAISLGSLAACRMCDVRASVATPSRFFAHMHSVEHLPDGGVPALRDGQSIVAIVGGDARSSSAPTQDNQRTISVFLENTATGDLQTGEVSVSATAEFPEVRAAVLSAFSLTAGTCDLICTSMHLSRSTCACVCVCVFVCF